MTKLIPTAARAALLLALLPATAAAQQSLFPEPAIMGGVEARQYNFDDSFGVDHLRQVAFPIAVAIPLGQRFSFDIGTWYASTSIKRVGQDAETFSSFTDTQLRLAYTFGSDAVVASVMVNLPTGKETTTLNKFNVGSSTSSSFLLFPVNSYGSGTSVTPGLAGAITAGQWNLGIAASVRWSAEYQPFNDSDTALANARYQPGIETRVRLGADRLIGQSRLTFGGTFSTFAEDELRGGGFGNGTFDPGNRFLVDASLASRVGRGILTVYAWDYYRTSSADSDEDGAIGGKENIIAGGVQASFPLGARVALEPLAEARFWMPEEGSGRLVGVGTALRLAVSPRIIFVPGVRVDFGSIRGATADESSSVTGWDASGLLRFSF